MHAGRRGASWSCAGVDQDDWCVTPCARSAPSRTCRRKRPRLFLAVTIGALCNLFGSRLVHVTTDSSERFRLGSVAAGLVTMPRGTLCECNRPWTGCDCRRRPQGAIPKAQSHRNQCSERAADGAKSCKKNTSSVSATQAVGDDLEDCALKLLDTHRQGRISGMFCASAGNADRFG